MYISRTETFDKVGFKICFLVSFCWLFVLLYKARKKPFRTLHGVWKCL